MAKNIKPVPGMLGTGGAASAGKALSNRQRDIDSIVNQAMGKGKKKGS